VVRKRHVYSLIQRERKGAAKNSLPKIVGHPDWGPQPYRSNVLGKAVNHQNEKKKGSLPLGENSSCPARDSKKLTGKKKKKKKKKIHQRRGETSANYHRQEEKKKTLRSHRHAIEPFSPNKCRGDGRKRRDFKKGKRSSGEDPHA